MNCDAYNSSKLLVKLFSLSLLAGLLVSCAKPPSEIVIIDNVQGYSFDDARELFQFSALAIRAGRVVETGRSELADKYRDAKVVDGAGKTLLPGLIDSHGHMSSLGYTLLSIDVRGMQSAKIVSDAIADYGRAHPLLKWLKGRGWNQVLWLDKEFPSAAILDAQVADRPVWLERIDGHAGWANSKAMQLAGIDRDTITPAGGEIVLDAQGNPSGVFIDNAMDLVIQAIPPPGPADIKLALEAASEHLLSLGITSVHDAGVSSNEHKVYRELADNGAMSVRIYGMYSSTESDLEQVLAAGHSDDSADMYTLRSVKIYTDGALGSHGAAMLEPYSDRPDHSGLLLTSAAQMRLIFDLSIKADFQIAIHAIGDLGNRIALDEIQRAYTNVGGRHLRHRIEHAQVVNPSDIPRFKILDVTPSMQPVHAVSDMNMAEDRLGSARLEGAYAWRTFLDQGSWVVSGSDFPIELANAFHGIHAAITRQNHDNLPEDGWVAEQAMSIEEAMLSFSLDGAWAAHQENIIGSLTPGKWADFILIDRDIYKIEPQDIWETAVLETWLAGERVFVQDQ